MKPGEFVLHVMSEKYSEWIETVDNPAEFLAGVLAAENYRLTEKIIYLERRIAAHEREQYANSRR